MNQRICQLDNESLLIKTKALAAKERAITTEVLHHLAEISKRRLFALKGFSSLFEYARRELGYSDAAAARRISAMRLLTEIPAVEEKIKSGELNLSNVAQAQNLFQAEAKLGTPITPEKKTDILKSIENKTTREAEQELTQHSSQPASIQRPDQIRAISPTHSEVRFVTQQALLEQLEKIRGFLSHVNPRFTLEQLIGEMAKVTLEKLEPKKPKASAEPQQTANESTQPVSELHSGAGVEKGDAVSPHITAEKGAQRSRYISAEVKRQVYHRDQGQCTFVDLATQRKCGSRFQIQFDHIVPFGQGGASTVGNLRIYCFHHNQLHASECYGAEVMAARIGMQGLGWNSV